MLEPGGGHPPSTRQWFSQRTPTDGKMNHSQSLVHSQVFPALLGPPPHHPNVSGVVHMPTFLTRLGAQLSTSRVRHRVGDDECY
jgi:hypothetical protein